MITGFHLPTDMGKIELDVDEVMYYLYMPISSRGNCYIRIPDSRLASFKPLWRAIQADIGYEAFEDWYMYITVKRMYVGAGITANRPGWHCDGYLSDDLNYVWYDCVPTIFAGNTGSVQLPENHSEALEYLDRMDGYLSNNRVTFQPKHLLKLDSGVIHKVDTSIKEQVMRTFVKITLSKNRFNLKGNSKNPMLPDDGEFFERDVIRNDPHQCKDDFFKPSENE